MSVDGSGSYRSTPGPINRTTFLDEQRRNRMAARRWSALAILTVAVMGTAVSAILTPTLYLAAALALRIANLLTPVPRLLAAARQSLSVVVRPLFQNGSVPLDAVVPALAVLLGPSIATVLLLWFVVYRVYLRAGEAGALVSLGAREPNPAILKNSA